MSNECKACVDHFDKLAFYHHDNMSGNSQNMTEPQGKAFHAKRLFNCWRYYKKKKCFSSRQGTTFITQYQANSYNNIVNKGQSYIYKKLYSNLDYNFSTKPSTKRQQEKRFERNCRRVCNNAGIDFATASREELLLASRCKSFLMTKLDRLTKPLLHLRYHKKFAYPLQVDYDFPIPTLPLPVIPAPIKEKPQPPAPSSSIDLFKVPDDLLAYIPDHPVYKGDIYNQLTDKQKAKLKPLQVGSKAWKQHIRALKSNKESELWIKQHDSQLREKAKFWNTSFDVISKRLGLAAQLTTLQDLQGEKALVEQEILMTPQTSNRNRKKVDKLKDKIRKLSPQIDKILSSLPSLKDTPYYITEEERALEL
ncbi:hypothetical protein C1646_781905 [Rhizophagus diaphanus]|nr:hypothetical protein C1646_781905 [Rhizophagus diaphanus] [Rhizophagus sp. MUCL 43196]